MLVAVAPDEVPESLATLGVTVLTVRHPVPALQRIMITKPRIILVGSATRHGEFELLAKGARHVDADILQLGPLVVRARLATWMREVLVGKDESAREG